LGEGENVKEIYVIRICGKCRKTNILINDEVEDTIKKGKFISCSHCGSKKVFEENETSDLRKCMDNNAYKRVKRKVRQVHSV
jgi:DNA-directed RNA polymerase subunit RPC12/RpoP